MRRWGLVFAILALAGCKALGDAFSAHPQVAGSAAGQTLTVSRLAELAGRAKKVPLRPQALTGLTTIYLDYRSEEHTSELQSPCNLVCRLLLEKKKSAVPTRAKSTMRLASC